MLLHAQKRVLTIEMVEGKPFQITGQNNLHVFLFSIIFRLYKLTVHNKHKLLCKCESVFQI
jgi:predicted acyltransferase